MKNKIKLLGAGLAIASIAGLSSCHDEQMLSGGQGVLKLSANINNDMVPVIKAPSRATAEELGLSDKCLIHICNSKGVVRQYKSISEIPDEGIKLVSDHYHAHAWAGDSVPASFDHQYYRGHEEFDISSGQTIDIALNCKIVNVVVAVNYDPEIDNFLKDYKFTVSHDRGSLEYVGKEERWGYFMMPSTDKNLAWKLEGTQTDSNEPYVKEGVIANATPSTLYTVKLNVPTNDDPIAGGFLTIEVDETPLDEINEHVEILAAPTIVGYDFNINEDLIAETGNVGHVSLVISGSAALTDVEIESDNLGSLVGDPENKFNLMRMSDEMINKFNDVGINYYYEYDVVEDVSWLKLNFEAVFTNRLSTGKHQLKVSATDDNGKTNEKTFTIICEEDPVKPAEKIDEGNVWATKATVTGQILKEDAKNPGVLYRVSTTSRADGDWMQATDVKVSGKTFTATLTGLQPGTTYEYTVTSDGFISEKTQTFSTEAAPQLPNASFEEWHSGKTSIDSKNLDLIFADGGSMFWDSGNHGSIKANTNVTEFSSDKKHSGNGCARLTSKFASIIGIGKLAAGNIFIGEYLGTDGTDGILGWGRPWTSRPTAVTMWVHYTPVAVSHQKDNPGGVKIGDMDTGKIYIAILDNSKRTDPKAADKPYPVIVNTKSQTFFDVNGDNVIAYGEIILDKATEGDQMVQVRIPLTYRSNKKASNIMMTASSSTYGDYFTGGEGSTLYIDDIQLEY